ncbi:MAG: YihY/virulence factor BrkB family protein [Anaerolineae bacterium]
MTERPNGNRKQGQPATRILTRLAWQVRRWIVLLLKAARAAMEHEASLTAASIGYYTLFSLFPLTLLTVALASLWLDPLLAEGEIITQLEFAAPALGNLLGDNIEQIVRTRGPVSGLASLTLLWSASNIFNVLTRTMDSIWGVSEQRSAWRHRGLAILMALVISSLMLMALFTEGTVLTILNSLLPENYQQFRSFTDPFWTASLSVLLFAMLYHFLPHIDTTWREVLPGAICAGLLWELAKRAFMSFIAAYLSRSNLVYGSMATITAFLTWTYLSSRIFLFGAHLNVCYAQSRGAWPGRKASYNLKKITTKS